MRHSLNVLGFFAAVLLTTGLLSCSKEDAISNDQTLDDRNPAWFAPPTTNVELIGLDPQNVLVKLTSGPPVRESARIPVTGMRAEELLVSIDTRPSTKEVYGVSSMNQLYTIDVETGVATAVGGGLSPQIQGKLVAFDFSPVDDKIRLITEEGQNLRINPTTGVVEAVEGLVNPGVAAFNSIAYSNSFGSAKPVLYGIDFRTGNVYLMRNPADGVATYLGPSYFNFGGEGGFDISPNNVAWAVSSVSGQGTQTSTPTDDLSQENYRLLNVNLRSGRASSYGTIRPLIGITAR